MWLHVSFVNQVNWQGAVVDLVADPDPQASREAELFGNIALRAAPKGVVANTCPFELWGVFPLPRIFAGCDFAQTCAFTLHAIEDSPDRMITSDFVPAQIEVKPAFVKPAVFWPGFSEASRMQKELRGKNNAKAHPIVADSEGTPDGPQELFPLDDAAFVGEDDPPEKGCGGHGGCAEDPSFLWADPLFDDLAMFEEWHEDRSSIPSMYNYMTSQVP